MRGGDDCFHEPGMVVLIVSGKTVADFVEWKFRQQRNAVERFLSMYRNVVAERFEWLARKCVIDALGFLQADEIRLALRELSHDRVKALLDRVVSQFEFLSGFISAKPAFVSLMVSFSLISSQPF